MPKTKTAVQYVCANCGSAHPRWAGRCSECGAWNTLEETATAGPLSKRVATVASPAAVQPITELAADPVQRIPTGSGEFDRVVGGGVVPGAIMLLGGEPGIGKSTLLLQLAGTLAKSGKVLYLSGEESPAQLSLRASRLGVDAADLLVVSSADTDQVIQTIVSEQPSLAVVDSIQTLSTERFQSGPGSITQVRESAARLQTVAKEQGIPIVLVGHVTKEGAIAGPKVLEHLVDTVLYLEGEKWHGYRLLRGAKNRFGPTDEVGVYTMTETGLHDVTDPSGVFIDAGTAGTPGTAITATLEGTRALLCEVQALAVETSFGYPKRTASGYDLNKLQLLIAVLTKRAGIKLGTTDVYFNVSGGYQLRDPAADLAAAAAIAGAVRNRPIAAKTVLIGEIGLSGEIRPVQALGKRVAEAARSGYRQAIIPKQAVNQAPSSLKLVPATNVEEALNRAIAKEARAA